MYHFQNVLVTGGAGFIGSNFIRILQQESAVKIVNLDKLTYAGSLENLKHLKKSADYHFIQGDITDKNLVKDILQKYAIDTIVHFAAESHVDRSIASPHTFIETNVFGTHVLLEAARYQWLEIEKRTPQDCRFHHISTDEVYGSLQPNDKPFTEETPYQPRSPYSASKASSDHLVQAYYHTYQLPVTLSNCSNNYGPNQHHEKFIPTIINACLNNRAIPIYGYGKNIRDWLYVDDHCLGILAILKHGKIGEQYNIGSDNEWENIHLAKYICDLMNNLFPQKISYHSLLQFVTDRPGHDFRYAIDFSKIKNQLNWQPLVPMSVGMEKTINFYV